MREIVLKYFYVTQIKSGSESSCYDSLGLPQNAAFSTFYLANKFSDKHPMSTVRSASLNVRICESEEDLKELQREAVLQKLSEEEKELLGLKTQVKKEGCETE